MPFSFIFIYSIFIFSFLRNLKKYGLRFIYIIPFYWIIEELLSTYFYIYDSSATISILTLCFIIYAVFKIGLINVFKANVFVFIFLLIAFINTPFSQGILSFTNRYLNLFNIYMILPISILIAQQEQDLALFKKTIKKTLVITIIYLIISSFFKLGPNMYDTGLIYGLRWSQFYGPAIAAVFLFTVLGIKQQRNIMKIEWSALIISIMMIIISMLTLRRTAILIILLFLFTYYLFTINRKNILAFLLISLVLFVSFMALEDFVSSNRSDRGMVLSKDYDITREGRYFDIFGVIEQMKDEDKLIKGYELFNEYGNYGAKRDTRPIHVDIMRIFFGVGIIGIIPLILILVKILLSIIKTKKYSNESFAVGLAAFLVFLLTLFTGGTLYISYSGLVFIIIANAINNRPFENKGINLLKK